MSYFYEVYAVAMDHYPEDRLESEELAMSEDELASRWGIHPDSFCIMREKESAWKYGGQRGAAKWMAQNPEKEAILAQLY